MYTSLENVRILISLLKQYGVKKLVLSPGNRDVPFVHSVEDDPFFECYSIVDERSAAYFALGLSLSSNEAVGFTCTSSTATCNYLPALIEAKKKNAKIIALTADRENYYLYQFEDQKIKQTGMYSPYVKYSADLPVIRNELDRWMCIRTTNEALLNLSNGIPGPVHINYQADRTDRFPKSELETVRKVDCIQLNSFCSSIDTYKKALSDKRVMVIVGEMYFNNKNLIHAIQKFQSSYNTVIISDHFSNLNDVFIDSSLLLESISTGEFERYIPDIVITVGGHIWSSIKYKLRNSKTSFEHWRISEDGIIRDGFKRLTKVFEFPPELFFSKLSTNSVATKQYYLTWEERVKNVKVPDLKFSNFSVIRKTMSMIPEGSIVHCSILNAARLNAFSKYSNKNIMTYCNFGAYGIDGCLSTFLGESNEALELSFLIIGDLSFLYDLNGMSYKLNNKQRILLINNHAGSEFHTSFGVKKFPKIDLHMAAGHHSNIVDAIDHGEIDYFSASNQEELEEVLPAFVSDSRHPILLEVFTEAKMDAEILNEFYKMNEVLSPKEKVRRAMVKIAKRVLRL